MLLRKLSLETNAYVAEITKKNGNAKLRQEERFLPTICSSTRIVLYCKQKQRALALQRGAANSTRTKI